MHSERDLRKANMFKDNPLQDQLRKERRADKLGKNPACARCGYSKPEALISVNKSLLEKHHVFLRANDPRTTIALCRNCHAIVTAAAYSAGAIRPASSCLERFESMLRALGSFLISFGERLLEWADEVAAIVAGLDRQFAGWREMLEAK